MIDDETTYINEGHSLGHGPYLVGRHDYLLGVGAQHGHAVHLLAHLPPRHACTITDGLQRQYLRVPCAVYRVRTGSQLGDDSTELGARDEGEGRTELPRVPKKRKELNQKRNK